MIDKNWILDQQKERGRYVRRKFFLAFLLGLILLGLLALAPEGAPYHRDNNRVVGVLGQGWDNLKSSFARPESAEGDNNNNEDNGGVVGVLGQGWDNLRSAFTEPQPASDETQDGEATQDSETDGEENSETASSDPASDSFAVTLPDNATSLTVDVTGAEGTELSLMVDGQELGSGAVGDGGEFVWTPNPDTVDTSEPKTTPQESVEQTVDVVPPSVADQIDATIPLFLAGKTAPASVVDVLVDGDLFERAAADADGNWTAELNLKSLKPGEHTISAETLLNNQTLPNTPSYTFDLKASDSSPSQENLLEVIMADGELSILNNAVETAGLENALISDEKLTVFAPTDSAFTSLPKPILDAFGGNLIALNELLLNHVSAGMVEESSLSNPLQSLGGAMINVENNVEEAIEAENGMLYKINTVLLPPPTITLPIVNTAGVESFKGNFLTVVGTAEPESNLLLTLNGKKFGEAIVSPEGTWGISGSIADGSYEIVAYTYTTDLELAVSETVVLEVEN